MFIHGERELEFLIEASFDGLFITDGNGIVLFINRAYERIAGIRREEVLGRSMEDLVTEGFYHESVTLRVLKSKRTETMLQRLRNNKIIVVTGNPVFDQSGNLSRVVTNCRDITEIKALQQYLDRFALQEDSGIELPGMVIRSRKMREIEELAKRLGPADSTVLIMGESGTGKEICASLVHKYSRRASAPFIKVSCAAIADNLLESELFGYAPGAFTGALRDGKKGLFEKAHTGTLFLDEVGELPLHLQSKLLRVLQEGELKPVGSTRNVPVDVRIIAATGRDLPQMVLDGSFRKDFYYRLNVVNILVPPLRERKTAIISLTYAFLHRFNTRYSYNRQIDTEVLEMFMTYDWPGNVRELQNIVEMLVVTAKGDVIIPEDLPEELRIQPGVLPSQQRSLCLKDILERAERGYLSSCLRRSKTTRELARRLGISQTSVVRKLKKYNLRLLN